MNKYADIYNRTPSEDEMIVLKESFADSGSSTSWEDYYWAGKCIAEYDTDDFDAKILSKLMNDAIKYGLTFRTNKECYLDAIKILASVYGIMGQYELVLNCLNSVLELDPKAPDWVFHDLVAAQNRTRVIKRNLRRPQMFLEDLAHNDGTKAATKKKQKNIFKEFLAAGIIYMMENPEASVDVETISAAARTYGVYSSKEMKTFLDACHGKVEKSIIDSIKDIEVIEESNIPKTPVKVEEAVPRSGGRPLVISLFPEDDTQVHDTADIERKYKEMSAKLEATQAELEAKNKELEKAGCTVEQLVQANNSLQATVDKYQADVLDYDKELREKQASVAELQRQLREVKAGSKESKDLEAKLAEAIKQQDEIASQVDAVKKSLEESEKRLKAAGEQIGRSAAENKALREALEQERNSNKQFSSNKSAVIRGTCKTFEVITTEKLAKWLTKQLSNYKGWWEKCVIACLKPEQILKAQEGHYSSLEEFDLAALLRIFNANWQRISTYRFMAHSEKECLSNMFGVRNNLAHSNAAPVCKDEVIEDLAIMSEFLTIIGANTESKEVAKFAAEVAKMEIA